MVEDRNMNAYKLARYDRLRRLRDRLDKQIEELRIAIIVDHTKDPTPPDNWRVSVSEYTSERVLGVREIKDRSPKLYESLTRNGIIYESRATRLTVKRTDG